MAGEMRHRIKNSLATVQALATHTLHSISAEELETFTARLHALASAHDLLATKPRSGASLGSVVTRALEAFQQDKREHLLIEGTETSGSTRISRYRFPWRFTNLRQMP